ncbi:hypothetical protein [Amycolatopsis thailandensis]|uniref:hypothetical protein n=1 Tax=Amycolatopsis thailandensis TaxID=589330 RepID=UPI00362F7DAA
MLIEPAPPSQWQAKLVDVTKALATGNPTATSTVLVTAWEGLVAARWCGLAVAADPNWVGRHANAESAEYDFAIELSRSSTLSGCDVKLPIRNSSVEALSGSAADSAVSVIIAFSAVIPPILLASARSADTWEDERTCRSSVRLARTLGECWQGLHPSYGYYPATRRH